MGLLFLEMKQMTWKWKRKEVPVNLVLATGAHRSETVDLIEENNRRPHLIGLEGKYRCRHTDVCETEHHAARTCRIDIMAAKALALCWTQHLQDFQPLRQSSTAQEKETLMFPFQQETLPNCPRGQVLLEDVHPGKAEVQL